MFCKNCNPSDLKFLPKNIKCHYFHVGNIAKPDREISGNGFHHPLSSLYFLKDKNFKFYSINDDEWSSVKQPSLEIELNEFKSIIPRFKVLSGNPIISLTAKKSQKTFIVN